MNEEVIDKYLDQLDKNYEEFENILPVDKLTMLSTSGSPMSLKIEPNNE